MKLNLPDDLLTFLSDDHQLEYDVDRSSIGPIVLKNTSELAVTTVALPDGCQSIIEDPYSALNGHYQVDIVDLVAESEAYSPEGLLCWLTGLRQFGMLDFEHGDGIIFPDVSWTDIANAPLNYLDALWGDDAAAERLLPWIHFAFTVRDSGMRLEPYGPRCLVHGASVSAQQVKKPPLFDVLRRRAFEDWLQNYVARFPCSGVPVSQSELLCCLECRSAEDAWIRQVEESIVSLDAASNEHGWILCPGCGIRFALTDTDRFLFIDSMNRFGVHQSCGQKIRVQS